MTTIRKDISIDAPADHVWDAVRDVGAVHQRLTPGLVVDAALDGEARVVTFANGMVLRELIVTVDDDARRFAYASVGGRVTHHNASIEVFDTGDGTARLVWTTDVLPDELAPTIVQLVEAGSEVIKRTLENRTQVP
jgi:carbon monoxide dehydrogenase subunit G